MNIKFMALNLVFILFLIITSCSNNPEENEQIKNNETNTEQTSRKQENIKKEIKTDSFAAGEKIFKEKCMVCHQKNGEGVEGTFPPLSQSDYLLSDKERAIIQTINGSKKPITVNGIEYPGNIMTVIELSDQEVADVVNYILNSWGNNGGTVSLNDVKAARKKIQ